MANDALAARRFGALRGIVLPHSRAVNNERAKSLSFPVFRVIPAVFRPARGFFGTPHANSGPEALKSLAIFHNLT